MLLLLSAHAMAAEQPPANTPAAGDIVLQNDFVRLTLGIDG